MIKYKDLSGCLKLAAILAWIAGGIMVLQFAIGFILGVTGG